MLTPLKSDPKHYFFRECEDENGGQILNTVGLIPLPPNLLPILLLSFFFPPFSLFLFLSFFPSLLFFFPPFSIFFFIFYFWGSFGGPPPLDPSLIIDHWFQHHELWDLLWCHRCIVLYNVYTVFPCSSPPFPNPLAFSSKVSLSIYLPTPRSPTHLPPAQPVTVTSHQQRSALGRFHSKHLRLYLRVYSTRPSSTT